MPRGGGAESQELIEVQQCLAAGNAEDARDMLELGYAPSPMGFNQSGLSLAHYATVGESAECLQLLAEVGVDLQAPCSSPKLDGATPAAVACREDLPEAMEALLQLGVDAARPCDKFGARPAKVAAINGSVGCLKALHTAGVELRGLAGDRHGASLLFYAVTGAQAAAITALGECGLDCAAVCDRLGFTPACYAATQDTTECLEALRDAGVDLGAPCDRWGRTAARYCVAEDQAASLKLLYLQGVDLRAGCDDAGKPPRALAEADEMPHLVELIDAMLLPLEQKPWKCKQCELENKCEVKSCILCGASRGSNPDRVLVPH